MIWPQKLESGSLPANFGWSPWASQVSRRPGSRRARGPLHGGLLPMPRLLTIMAAQLLGVWAIGVSVSLAQEPAPRNEAAPRAEQRGAPVAREAAPKQAIDPAMMDWLLKQWEKQSTRLKTLDVAILRIDDIAGLGRPGVLRGPGAVQEPQPGLHRLQQDQAGREEEADQGSHRIPTARSSSPRPTSGSSARGTRSGSIAATRSRSSSSRSRRTSSRRPSRRGRCRSSSTCGPTTPGSATR